MTRLSSAAVLLGLFCLSPARAELFPRGPEALKYGAYTGGHGYSYNTAYSYGLSFSPADSWWRDPFAYPAGVYPYRPYGRPILYRVYPTPPTPYISVPGPNGLPILVRPDGTPLNGPGPGLVPVPVPLPAPAAAAPLTVLPASAGLPLTKAPASEATSARIRISAPAGAEVWVEKKSLPPALVFHTLPLAPGRTYVYSVRARWTEAGREVEQYRIVGVRAGESSQVTFTQGR